MIRGELIALRARFETDVPVLYAELYGDVVTRAGADNRPWVPLPPARTPYTSDPTPDAAVFTVVEPAAAGEGERLAGEALLWGIDLHNRSAHIGISLFPGARRRGIGTDVVRVLCEYGFAVRGLRRLQIETLAGNAAMLATARKAGFTVEGTRRQAAWAYGEFADQVILGLLVEEWRSAGGRRARR